MGLDCNEQVSRSEEENRNTIASFISLLFSYHEEAQFFALHDNLIPPVKTQFYQKFKGSPAMSTELYSGPNTVMKLNTTT